MDEKKREEVVRILKDTKDPVLINKIFAYIYGYKKK